MQKMVILLLLACLGLILLFCAAMIIDFNQVETLRNITITDEHMVQWELDPVKFGAHHVTISGWALVELEPLTEFDTSIILQDTATGKSIQLPTTVVKRGELNEKYPDGTDYSQCGFLAKANSTLIHLDTTSYKVLLKYFNNDHQVYVDTGQLIGGGE
jgi:hypothetical protein